jgi:hypothetical protein
MSEVKWSAKATKAAPVAADHTLIVDSDDGASKYVALGTFPFGTPAGVQNGTYIYAATAGGTTAYTLTVTPAIAALAAGQKFRVLVNATNTGASTLAVSGKAATAINKQSAAGAMVALAAGDLVISTIAELVYDGTVFELLNPGLAYAASAAACTGNAATVTGFSPTSGKTLSVSKTMTLTCADDTAVATLPAGAKTLLAADGSGAALTSLGVPVGAAKAA